MIFPQSSVFVTGVAQISKNDAINTMYGTFSLSLIIDTQNDTIISMSCNMVMPETVEFVRQLLVGKNIVTDLAEMVDTIKKRFLALSQKALIVALRDAQNHYLMAYPANKNAALQNL